MTGSGPILRESNKLDNDDWLDELVCPKCDARLLHVSDKLLCGHCNESVSILNGIPQFATNFPYWGEISREQMLEVNRRAAQGSWKAALLDFDDPAVQQASG